MISLAEDLCVVDAVGNPESLKRPERPVVGVIVDRRAAPHASATYLWSQTVRLLAEAFRVVTYDVDAFVVDCDSARYQAFAASIDVLVLLSPVFVIDRSRTPVPVVVFALNLLQTGGYWLYRKRRQFRAGDSVIVNSAACENILQAITGGTGMQAYRLPLAVDTTIFYPRADRSALRRKYGLPEGRFMLIYSGRYSFPKNCDLVLTVLHDLRRTCDAHLVLVGSYDTLYFPEFTDREQPDLQAGLDQLTEQLGLAGAVTMIPHQNDPQALAELLAASDVGICLTTLIGENFGYTPVEMQACGLPVVGTDWAGLRDTIVHGETGFRVDTLVTDYGVRVDFEQASAYLAALARDPELRAALSQRAAEHAQAYAVPHYQRGLRDIILDTLRRAEDAAELPELEYHAAAARMFELLTAQRGDTPNVFWVNLYPTINLDYYYFVLSHCATRTARTAAESRTDGLVRKAFDWWLPAPGEWRSHDLRWNAAFELSDLALTHAHLDLLWQIDHQSRRLEQLRANSTDRTLFDATIRELLHLGFIVIGPAAEPP